MEPQGLSHIGLRTADLDRAARFYTTTLPGEVLRRRDEPDRRVWVRLLGITLEIAEVPAWEPLSEAQLRAVPQISLLARPPEVRVAEGRRGPFALALLCPLLQRFHRHTDQPAHTVTCGPDPAQWWR